MTTEMEPTLEDVGELETRLVDLELEVESFGQSEVDLTQEIENVHAASGDKKVLDKLKKQRQEAREQRVDALEGIAALKSRIDTDLELACAAEAKQRLAKIPKAYTTLVIQYEQAVARLVDAATGYAKQSVVVHETFGALGKMRAERAALVDRFEGVATASIHTPTAIIAPARHEGVRMAVEAVAINFADHAHIATALEKDEHGIRSRRSYMEVSGTPGYGIIQTAGAKSWPALTEKERAILDARKADAAAEVRESRRFAGEGDRSTERPGLLGAAG